MNDIGIYIHVPFCVAKCKYCNFYSLCIDKREEYVSALIRDINAFEGSYSADSVFFGGGTPSLLKGEDFGKILSALNSKFRFSENCEITSEANPESAGYEKLRMMKEAGINRISLGVQSFSDKTLKIIGRAHDSMQAESAIENIKKAGFENFNIDLIHSLPFEHKENALVSLDKALSFSPCHISYYGLKVEKGTPLYKERNKLEFCTEDEYADIYASVCERLSDAGYIHYEVSNFAKKGMECRHNMRYWERGEYIGFGPSAHSFVNGKRYYYKSDLSAYIENKPKKISEGRVNKRYEEIMLGLRTCKGIVLSEKEYEISGNFISKCEQSGYLIRNGNAVFLTERGFSVSNALISEILYMLNL